MKKIAIKKTWGIIALIIIILGSIVYGLSNNNSSVTTDDAYVGAHVVQIAPRVTGQVQQLLVNNNQFVQTGQPLFTLDFIPFEISIQQTEAQLSKAQEQEKIARITAGRMGTLVTKKAASAQEDDQAQAALKAAIAETRLAQANLEKNKLNLQYATVKSPASGWVTNVSVRVGDTVKANDSLFVLIDDDNFWIDANFKETEMEKIRPGQKVDIEIDMYPEHPFSGIVESISGGSGSAFSLLPPENATGNWVKVTQRVPVRIRILNPDPAYPLRVGTSATVTVHLKK